MTVLGARDTKIHDFDIAIGLHHNILRLDIAMDDVVFMSYRECLGDLGANLSDFTGIKRSVFADAAFEVSSPEVLHDDVV